MKTRDKIFFSALFAFLVLILFLAIFGNKGFIDLNRLKQQHNLVVNKNIQITLENKYLIDEINRLKHDLDYIETVARRELGLVSEDELVFKPK
jgi:cell division protein FtsB